MTHQLKTAIEYNVDLMDICFVRMQPAPGFCAIVIRKPDGEKVAINPSDDYNLTRYMGYEGARIIGRGVLTEKLTSDEWFVSWRAYSPKPEYVEWEE